MLDTEVSHKDEYANVNQAKKIFFFSKSTLDIRSLKLQANLGLNQTVLLVKYF